MVLPVKIFEIKGDANLSLMGDKLRALHEEEPYQTGDGRSFTLVTEILDLRQEEDTISGFFSKDFVRGRLYRREAVEALITEEVPFWIRPFKKRVFLMVMAPSVARGVKKLLTNHVANKIGEALYGKVGFIVEVRIPDDKLRRLHESNPQATKLIWFDDIDIPSVEKLCLAGSGLADTNLYRDYLQHGRIWYVVFEVQKRRITVGVTRNGVVTLFSKSTADDFIKYLLEDLLDLIQ